jgi:membrane glycosyltransferase
VSDIASRRWLYLYLVLASTALAVSQLLGVLGGDGLSSREGVILALFTILFAWIGAAFWLALFGAFARIGGEILLPLKPADGPSAARTAILMPVYNEDSAQVFSGVRAIWESAGPDFDFYILSDSTDPAAWVGEELAWRDLRRALGEKANIFYRHRPRNTGRKSGNIQDFCENWGQLYDYMVVLDADSLMTGETLARLVGLMDANPRAALIQAPAQLVGRSSLFARIQQFASSVYGPLHNAGLAWLQGPDGNYWGHNAIIRVHAFMEYCGLPKLPGKPPFGGEIMSHDFIEAAFLRRAGWQVWMAPDLGGSFEQPPPTLYDHLVRDRRWCQGNLQHLRIIFARGLAMPSRLHLALGIMTYLSSPLWLLLLVISVIDMIAPHGAAGALWSVLLSHTGRLVILVLVTIILLYGPKILAVIQLARDPAAVRAHGGKRALVHGVVGEALFSTLMAPIVMLQHSWFVFTILMGIATGWAAQQRSDRALPWGFVARQFGPHTVVGFVAAALLWRYAPHSFGWFLPLLAGLVLAIPVVVISSSLTLGAELRQDGLFLVPSESQGLPILDRAHLLAAEMEPPRGDVRHLVLEDPDVRSLHLALLADSALPEPSDRAHLARLLTSAQRRETARFSREDWRALLSDPESLKAL